MDCLEEFKELYPQSEVTPNIIIYNPRIWEMFETWVEESGIDFYESFYFAINQHHSSFPDALRTDQ